MPRVLWRQKLAIAFLFLAWPYPYEKYLLGVLNAFTNLTLLAMEKIAVWTHLAAPAASSDNAVFSVTHHGTPFSLSIVSACSGVNGVVGFLLVGLGLRGHRPRSDRAQGALARPAA